MEISAQVLVVSNDGRLLFSGGHWDCSLRVTQLGKGKLVGRICRHIGKFPGIYVLLICFVSVLLTIFHMSRADVVTCLALDLCGIYLISGSRDTSCIVWQVLQQVTLLRCLTAPQCYKLVIIRNAWLVVLQGGFSSGLSPRPVQVLCGHDQEVTCVAISTELDMAVSGSKVSN